MWSKPDKPGLPTCVDDSQTPHTPPTLLTSYPPWFSLRCLSHFVSHYLLFLLLDSWTEKPAFGTGLDEHLKRSGREIALPIEACVMMLLETGMKEEVRKFKQRGGERLDRSILHDYSAVWIKR